MQQHHPAHGEAPDAVDAADGAPGRRRGQHLAAGPTHVVIEFVFISTHISGGSLPGWIKMIHSGLFT